MAYTVTINLDDATMAQFNDTAGGGKNPWSLVGCKSVVGPSDGVPVVWFTKVGTFMSATTLSWEEDDFAYVSESQIVPDGLITTADAPVAILANQTATYAGVDLSVSDSGNAGPEAQYIAIFNDTNTGVICGLAKVPPNGADGDGAAVPICAFPVDGNAVVNMLPRVQILLMFTSAQVNTAAVAEKAYGAAIVITLTGHDGDSQLFTVSYDKDTSWNANGAGWATTVPALAALAPILNPDQSSSAKQQKKLAA